MPAPDAATELRLVATVDLIGRTGARDFQLRYSDDEEPTVWIAVADYGDRGEAAASLAPLEAVTRLAALLIDGGTCTHCGRRSVLERDRPEFLEDLAAVGPAGWPAPPRCAYRYDGDTGAWRRGCDG